MKLFLLMLFCPPCFLGGYYCGHLPNSPDIIGWARDRYDQCVQAKRQVMALIEAQDKVTAGADQQHSSRRCGRADDRQDVNLGKLAQQVQKSQGQQGH